MAQVIDASPQPSANGFNFSASPTLALFLVSSLGLFLELLLIRWVSTEIRIFAYLQNTVLVVCMLGLGMGCWDCRKPFALRHMLLPLLGLVALLSFPPTRVVLGDISALLGVIEDVGMWSYYEHTGWKKFGSAGIGLFLTLVLMILLWDIFVPVGRLLGKLLNDHPQTLWAYSVNVAGSLVGVWLFVLLSAFYLPPAAWFAVFAGLALIFLGTGGFSKRYDAILLTATLGVSLFGGFEPGWLETVWSPYQKLSVQQLPAPGEPAPEKTVWDKLGGQRTFINPDVGRYAIAVNNAGYQGMLDLSPEYVARYPDRFPPRQRACSQYDIPARLHSAPDKLLIVGAGSGNDAAGALRNGAKDVVAVEIDPAIIEFGKRWHPEQPYADPRVRLVNDDARSYFATSTEKFDVIAFGLLDSHTTTAMTNARLDHYVYTRESLTQAKRLLNENGIVVLSFEAQKGYLSDRMARSLEEVFGHKPLTFRIPANAYGWGGVVFVAGNPDGVAKRLAEQPDLDGVIKHWQQEHPVELTGTTPVATDDWPYIYLEKPRIPYLYYLLAGVLAVLFVRGVRKLDVSIIRGWGRSHSHFFFLGAAFMLLEVQNVSKAAVVLGNTWEVNAVIISGVLGMVLAANFATSRLPNLPVGPVYALLIASCLGLYFLDLSTFAFLPYPTKAVVVGGLTSLPMLFSGIVFARSFTTADRKDAAIGANLFGALIGALLQSVTFLVGVKALLLIVAVLYLAALLTRPAGPAGSSEPSDLASE